MNKMGWESSVIAKPPILTALSMKGNYSKGCSNPVSVIERFD